MNSEAPTASERHLAKTSRMLFFGLAVAIAGVIILNLTVPFGTFVSYTSAAASGLSPLGPQNRLETTNISGISFQYMTDDLIYFSTDMPHDYDSATVSLTYWNPYPDQDIYVGFHDQTDWHYATKLVESPLLNSLNWSRLDGNPALYMRRPDFDSVKSFFAAPPQNSIIGLYNYDSSGLPTPQVTLPGYEPGNQETVIDTPLRGKMTIYSYLDREPFRMTVEKQDLNWYENPDIVTVDIYKEGDLVFRLTIDDDGDDKADHQVLPPQTGTIENPGPGLPEPGLYKIVIDSTGDSIVKKITTNLHKLVFDGPVYPIANPAVYPGVITATAAATLYANDVRISAVTYHNPGLQTLLLDGRPLPLSSVKEEVATFSATPIEKITIPGSDVIINGVPGFFAFSEDAYFNPTKYQTYQLTPDANLDFIDYILADYEVPVRLANGWKKVTAGFDLSPAVAAGGKLSWLIKSPKLRENGRKIGIAGLSVSLSKKPIL